MTYVMFDIGGTKTRVVLSEDLETLGEVTSFKTPNDFDEGVKMMIEAIEKLTDKKIDGIAGGIRGALMEDKSGIQNDGVLTKWAGKPLVGKLTEHFNTEVFLENDASIAAIGEAVFGAGKDLEIVAYHTISTGVGGARVVDGELDEASIGFEPGHQILDIDRTILGEDVSPTLENLVSGTGVKNRFNTEPYEIPQSDILWEELAEYLSQGLRNTILYWSPDVIVLGGSMIIGDPRIEIDAIRRCTVNALDGLVDSPHITMAELGDSAGLYGGMAILKKRL
jgi:glucokinase